MRQTIRLIKFLTLCQTLLLQFIPLQLILESNLSSKIWHVSTMVRTKIASYYIIRHPESAPTDLFFVQGSLLLRDLTKSSPQILLTET